MSAEQQSDGKCRKAPAGLDGLDEIPKSCRAINDAISCELMKRCFWGCNPSPWSNTCINHCMESGGQCADLSDQDICEMHLDCRWEVERQESNPYPEEAALSAAPQTSDGMLRGSGSVSAGNEQTPTDSSDVALIVLVVVLAFVSAFVVERIGRGSASSKYSPTPTVTPSNNDDKSKVHLGEKQGTSSSHIGVQRYTGVNQNLLNIPRFVALSSGTEFGHYQEAQWSFLLSGSEITTFIMKTEIQTDGLTKKESGNCSKFRGCVLSVALDTNSTIGLGMVLVAPKHRRKGIARHLIKAVMEAHDGGMNGVDASASHQRLILAVCSEMGHPLYRSLGFQDVGMVHAMTCPIKALRRHAKCCKKRQFQCVSEENTHKTKGFVHELDKRAIGYNRKERLDLLLRAEYATDAFARIVLGFDNSTKDGDGQSRGPCSFAIVRQECPSGPLIVGPVVGPPASALPLLCHISQQHFLENDENSSLSILVSNHKEDVVNRLMQIKGFRVAWTGPSMSSDAKPIYRNEEIYLALMHPTLG